MRTGTFAIDYMQVGLLSIGTAELGTGADGEITAQLTVLAPDGEFYSYYWLQVDPAKSRIEYLHFEELEGEIVRDGDWPIEGVSAWNTEGDEDMLANFSKMARAAHDLDITPLRVGANIETLGGPLDQETFDELAPHWSLTGRSGE